jgi:glucans biosynthesis protein
MWCKKQIFRIALYPVAGKRRCWAHGGAPGSGAPMGNQNRVTHGFYTAEAMAERKMMNDYLNTLKNGFN